MRGLKYISMGNVTGFEDIEWFSLLENESNIGGVDTEEQAKYIVQAVNEYEQLKEENEGLKIRLESEQNKRVKAGEMALDFQKENERLKEEVKSEGKAIENIKVVLYGKNEIIEQLTKDRQEGLEMLEECIKVINHALRNDDTEPNWLIIHKAEQLIQSMKEE